MIIGLFLFTQVFPTGTLLPRRYWIAYIPFFIAALFIIPFNLLITGITISPEGVPLPINGPLLPYYAAGWGFYFLLGMLFLGKKYFKIRGYARLQMKYFFVGIGIFLTATFVFDLLLPALDISYLNLLGPLSSLVFVGLTSYAIIRHQLMDIRVVIQRGLIYSILAASVLLFYVVTINIVGFVFQQVTPVTAFLSAALTTLIAVFSVPVVERYLRKVTDKIFFKNKYDYSEALHELSEVLNKNIKLKNILRSISETLKSILRIEKVAFLLIPQCLMKKVPSKR